MWKRDGTCLSFHEVRLDADLDLARPYDGIKLTTLGQEAEGASEPISVLQVHLASQPLGDSISDSWERGDDVVVVYRQSRERPHRTEIYWRRLSPVPPQVAALELLVSVQTSLLGTGTSLATASVLPASEVLWISGNDASGTPLTIQPGDNTLDRVSICGCAIFRCANSSVSYLEMIEPSDFLSATLHWSHQTAELRWDLFPDSLEKGVIRRARLRGILLPRSTDLADATRCYRDFIDSPPPLDHLTVRPGDQLERERWVRLTSPIMLA